MKLMLVALCIVLALGNECGVGSKSTVGKPTLTYFNLSGKGEVARLILEEAGRYLARKHGLAGGDLQMARIDAIAEGISDLSAKLREAFRYPVDSERPAKIINAVDVVLPQWFGYFENLIKGKNYFGGDEMTYADLKMFVLISQAKNSAPHGKIEAALQPNTFLAAMVNRVSERPAIKAYYDREPYGPRD